MELYHQILAGYLTVSQQFDNLIDAPSIVEGICYRTLSAIQEILKDPVRTGEECFHKNRRNCNAIGTAWKRCRFQA